MEDRGPLLGHVSFGLTNPTETAWQLRQSPFTLGFAVHDSARLNGREHVVLRTKPKAGSPRFLEVWVDTARDSAIMRCSSYVVDAAAKNNGDTSDTGRETTRTEVRYQQTPHGWLAEAWTAFHFSQSGNAIYRRSYVVKSIDVDLPVKDSQFHINRSPGMIFKDVEKDLPTSVEPSPGERPITRAEHCRQLQQREHPTER